MNKLWSFVKPMSMRMWENLDSNITSTNSRRIHSFVANSAFITGVNLSIPFVGWNYKMSHFPSLILRRPRRFNLLSFTTLLSIQFNHSPQTEVNSYPESVVENIFPLVSSRFAALFGKKTFYRIRERTLSNSQFTYFVCVHLTAGVLL